MPSIALIGYGYWGKNLLRNVNAAALWDEVYVFDTDAERLAGAAKVYPGVISVNSLEDILRNPRITEVVVCTPPNSHYDICVQNIEHGKNILVEKPFTTSFAKAQELAIKARSHGVRIMVDFTFLYTGAVEKIKRIYQSGDIGRLLYIDSMRINLGIFRSDINVLFDLACHDLSIIEYVTGEQPCSVQATGTTTFNSGLENIAFLTLYYEEGFFAHLNCSWTSPVKIRQTLFAGMDKMIVYNDIEPSDKVKVYEASFTERDEMDRDKTLIDYRTGDVYSPHLDNTEALAKLVQEFFDFTVNKKPTRSDADMALRVLKVLEAANESLNNGGKKVDINW